MKYLHIDSSNKKDLDEFKLAVHSKTPIFALIYMEGCGPCNATRPEWSKLKNADLKTNKNIMIVDIDNSLLDELKEFPKIANVAGFPNMKFIHGKEHIEEYNGGRTVDDFVRWIQSKSAGSHHVKKGGGKSRSQRRYRKRTTKRRRTRYIKRTVKNKVKM